MNKYLTQKIKKLRESIGQAEGVPLVSLCNVCGNVYQLLFLSCGCDNACTFCNYGFDYNLTKEMVLPELKRIDLKCTKIDLLELEANGSFLSEREIPYDLFIATLEYVKGKNIPIITIETHYKTITERKIQDIRRILGDEQVISFEVGFESSSEKIRKFYNKDISNDDFIKTAILCHEYNISMDVNVLLGAPFVSREEQIKDCLNTLDFIFNNLPEGTSCVLFPVNIKSNTMLDVWRRKGIYNQISSWEFVELLHRVPEEYIDKITIAWWGNRKNSFTDSKEIIHPVTCEKCNERLMNFYESFYLNHDKDYRKMILDEIWESRCECDL